MGTAKGEKRRTPRRKPQPQDRVHPVLLEVEKQGNTYSVVDSALEIAVSRTDLNKAFNEYVRLRSAVLDKLTEAGFSAPDDSTATARAKAVKKVSAELAARKPARESRVSTWASRERDSGFGDAPPRRSEWFAGIAAVVAILLIALAMIPVLGGIRAANLGMARLKEAARAENVSRLASQSIVEFAEALKRVTPARREEIRKSLRIIAQELRPYASELAPMFDAEEPSPVRRQSGGQRRGR